VLGDRIAAYAPHLCTDDVDAADVLYMTKFLAKNPCTGYISYSSQAGAAFASAKSKVSWPNTQVGPNYSLDFGDSGCPGGFCASFMVLARVVIDLVAGTCVEEATLLIDNCGTSTSHASGAINFASNGDMIIFSGEHAGVSHHCNHISKLLLCAHFCSAKCFANIICHNTIF
jgi:hypothetical protein